MLDIKCVS